MTIETYAYLASSVIGALVGMWTLASVVGDARSRANQTEPRRTVAASNVRRIVLLTMGVALSLVLCVWVLFFAPVPAGVARWLLVGINVSVTLTLIFEQVARREYEKVTE